MEKSDHPWESKLHKVSPYNYAPEVRQPYNFRKPIILQDWTIAKADHMDGSRLFSTQEYVEIAQLLEEIGIQETVFITTMYPSTPKDECIWEGLRAVAKLGRKKLKVRAWGYFAMWQTGEYQGYIDKLADTGADLIGLSALPPHVLRRHRLEAPGPGFEERFAELPKAIDYARKKGLEVCVSSAQAVREDFQTLIDRLNYYLEHGAESLLLSDSKGFATVDASRYFMTKVRAALVRDVPIWYHVHDIFGLATASALAVASAGAYPQVTVNGIADRGFASLEEVAMALEYLYGIPTGINTRMLPQLCRTVERITGVRNPPHKPIVGEHINVASYGAAYIGLLQGKSFLDLDLLSFELEVIGMRPDVNITYGTLSPAAVRAKLEQMRLPTEEPAVTKVRAALLDRLHSIGNVFPVMLNDAEVEQVCRDALGS